MESKPGKVDMHVIIPADLHARLRALAARQARSLNAQIVYMLGVAMATEKDDGGDGR